jgi:hypothetical protein
VGDSTLVWGVDTLEFERLTGLRAYNLGSLMMVSIDGMLITTKAYLSKHPAPRVIVLSVSPFIFQYSHVESPFAQRFIRTYGRQLGIVNHKVHDTQPVLIKRGATIARDYCSALMSGDFASCRDQPLLEDTLGYSYSAFQRKRSELRGHDTPPGDYSPEHWVRHETNPISGTRPPVHPPSLPVKPEWDGGVRHIARLADQANILLLVRLAPVPTGNDPHLFADLVSWLNNVQKDFPHTVIKVEVCYFDVPLFWDLVHLNTRGTKKFTKLVAADVLAAMNDGRRSESSREKLINASGTPTPKSEFATSRLSGPPSTGAFRSTPETLSAEGPSGP